MIPLPLIAGVGILAVTWGFSDWLTPYLPAVSGVNFGLTRNDVRIALRYEAMNQGFDPAWFDAIAKVESSWKLDAVNNTGGDSYYGGSYGPMQMTAATAKALGYDASDFLKDASIAAKAAAANLKQANPKSLQEAASYWNTGTKNFASLDPSNSFVTDYWPKLVKAYEWVQANPPT